MSAIGGILRFDGQPVARRDLERMTNALRMYGRDRAEILAAPPVGMVHTLTRFTPEDRFDRQPMRGASGAVMSADLRLDNRDDILSRLGVATQDSLSWPDSRVALTAWEKFGDRLWPMLHGPFAIAVWYPRDDVLTLARDQLGFKVVMWHKAQAFFAFATMPKGLFTLPDVPRELSQEKVADFLVLNHAEHETTFFREIFRLPPAHFMKVKPDGSVTQRRYWSVEDIPPLRLGSDAAYAEGLRAVLDKAVRRQMRSAHPIGCYLSGGLDSSSVATLAAHALAEKGQRLAAFTQVPRQGFDGTPPRGSYIDEMPYVEAIRTTVGTIDVTYVRNDACDDFADLERLFLAMECPVRNPSNLGWMLAIPRLAHAQGRRVLLGGLTGNFTISWFGWSQVADHLLRGRLLTAFRQWRQFYRHGTDAPWASVRKLLIEPIAATVSVNRQAPNGRMPAWRSYAPIRPEFAAEMGVDARAAKVGHDFRFRMRRGERVMGLTMVDYLGDWLAAETAVHGVEIRDPTADMDVVAYCFGVPPEQFLAEDVDRSLIRRAMWGLLPEIVLANRRMGHQAADWYEKLAGRRTELASEIAALAGSSLASKVIDIERLQRSVQNWPTEGWHTEPVVEEYQLALTRGIAAGRFLRWIESANASGDRAA